MRIAQKRCPKKIVFEGTTDSEYSDWGIWISNLDGTEAKRVISEADFGGPGVEEPTLSPDGLEVAYSRYESSLKQTCIELMSIDGGRSVSVYCGHPTGVTWSPNGYELAFSAETKGTKSAAILAVNLKTGVVRQVADWVGRQSAPTFSPTGSAIAFETVYGTSEAVEPGIWVVDSDGTNLHQLTSNYESEPAWSPDGSEIAVAAFDESEINGDNGGLELITGLRSFRGHWLKARISQLQARSPRGRREAVRPPLMCDRDRASFVVASQSYA